MLGINLVPQIAQYFEGESIIYNYVVITNKYVWVSWIGGSGNSIYMAVKDITTREKLAVCNIITL